MGRYRLPLYIRATAAILLAAFLVQDTAWAVESLPRPAVGLDPFSIRLNDSLGRLDSARKNGQKLVIHIRDAHTNPGAQRNIAAILSDLKKHHGVQTIFLEGGTRDDSLGHLAERAPIIIRERVANQFLLSGELSGAEYLNVTAEPDLKLLGVEDAGLYGRNLKRYAEVVKNREKVLVELARIRQRVSSLKRKYYSKSMLDFDEAALAFRSKESAFSDYFDRIQEKIKSQHINALGYPHLLLLGYLKEKEDGVDFASAQKELGARLAKMADGLRPSMPIGKLKRGSPAELQFFESVLKSSSDPAPALSAYVAYLREFSKIDLEKVLSESEALEDECFRGMDSLEARRLHAIDRHLGRLEDLFRMQISRNDFERLQTESKDIRYRTVSILAFLNRLFTDAGRFEDVLDYKPEIDKAKEPAEMFYRENDLRDEAMVRNVMKYWNSSGQVAAVGQTAEDPSAVVLVAGGYHTENLKRLLAKQNISYAVVSPNVEVETNHERYEKVLFEGLPSGPTTKTDIASASSMNPLPIAERPVMAARLAAEMGPEAVQSKWANGKEKKSAARLAKKQQASEAKSIFRFDIHFWLMFISVVVVNYFDDWARSYAHSANRGLMPYLPIVGQVTSFSTPFIAMAAVSIVRSYRWRGLYNVRTVWKMLLVAKFSLAMLLTVVEKALPAIKSIPSIRGFTYDPWDIAAYWVAFATSLLLDGVGLWILTKRTGRDGARLAIEQERGKRKEERGPDLLVLNKLFPRYFNILKDFLQKPAADVLAFVHRHGRDTAIGVAKSDVAAPLTNSFEPELAKDPNNLEGFERGEPGAQTATRTSWSPTNLRGLRTFLSDLRHSLIAFWMRSISWGSVLAWVWHPRIPGTDATNRPSSSSSIKTTYSKDIKTSPDQNYTPNWMTYQAAARLADSGSQGNTAKSIDAIYDTAKKDAKAGRHDEAQEALWAALRGRIFPSSTLLIETMEALIDSLHESGRDDRRSEAAELAIAAAARSFKGEKFLRMETDLFAYLALSQAMEDEGRIEKAISYADQAMLQLMLAKQGRIVLPPWFDQYARLQGYYADLLVRWIPAGGHSKVADAEDRFSKAVAVIQRAGEMDPAARGWLLARAGMAKWYLASEDPARAPDLIKEARVLSAQLEGSEHPNTFALRALLSEMDGDPDLAISWYERAGSQEGATTEIGELFARLLIRRGQADRAKAILEEQAKADPGDISPLGIYLNGLNHYLRNEDRPALEIWKKISDGKVDDYLRRTSDYKDFHLYRFLARRRLKEETALRDLLQTASDHPAARKPLIAFIAKDLDRKELEEFASFAARQGHQALLLMTDLKESLGKDELWNPIQKYFEDESELASVEAVESAWKNLFSAPGSDWKKFFKNEWPKLKPDYRFDFWVQYAAAALDHPSVKKNHAFIERIAGEVAGVWLGEPKPDARAFFDLLKSLMDDPSRRGTLNFGPKGARPLDTLSKLADEIRQEHPQWQETLVRMPPADGIEADVQTPERTSDEAFDAEMANLEREEAEEVSKLLEVVSQNTPWAIGTHVRQQYGIQIRAAAILGKAMKNQKITVEKGLQIIRQIKGAAEIAHADLVQAALSESASKPAAARLATKRSEPVQTPRLVVKPPAAMSGGLADKKIQRLKEMPDADIQRIFGTDSETTEILSRYRKTISFENLPEFSRKLKPLSTLPFWPQKVDRVVSQVSRRLKISIPPSRVSTVETTEDREVLAILRDVAMNRTPQERVTVSSYRRGTRLDLTTAEAHIQLLISKGYLEREYSAVSGSHSYAFQWTAKARKALEVLSARRPAGGEKKSAARLAQFGAVETVPVMNVGAQLIAPKTEMAHPGAINRAPTKTLSFTHDDIYAAIARGLRLKGPVQVPVAVSAMHPMPIAMTSMTPLAGGAVSISTTYLNVFAISNYPNVPATPVVYSGTITRGELSGRSSAWGQTPKSDEAGGLTSALRTELFPGNMLGKLADLRGGKTGVVFVPATELLDERGRIKSQTELSSILGALKNSLVYQGLQEQQLVLAVYGNVPADQEASIRENLTRASRGARLAFINTLALPDEGTGLVDFLSKALVGQGIRIDKILGVIFGEGSADRLGDVSDGVSLVQTEQSDKTTSAYSILVVLGIKDGNLESLPKELRSKIRAVLRSGSKVIYSIIPTPILDVAFWLSDLSRRTAQISA